MYKLKCLVVSTKTDFKYFVRTVTIHNGKIVKDDIDQDTAQKVPMRMTEPSKRAGIYIGTTFKGFLTLEEFEAKIASYK
jgi:hypothetical protein